MRLRLPGAPTADRETQIPFLPHLRSVPAPDREDIETVVMDRITFNPDQCGGRPCIRGMRIRVKDILAMLAAGMKEAEILEDYPYFEADDIRACLEYAAAEEPVGKPGPAAE